MAKIGEILVQKALITPAQLDEACGESQRRREFLGKTLVRLAMITEAQLLEVLAEQMSVVFYPSLQDVPISQAAVEAVPVKFALHYKAMPITLENGVLTVAVSDPTAAWSIEELQLHIGHRVERVLATEEDVMAAIRRVYGLGAQTVGEILENRPQEKKDTHKAAIEDVGAQAQDASVVSLVNQMLAEAAGMRATDIHFEPYRSRIRMRYRVDGVLYDMNVPAEIKHLYKAIVSRIKIIANLDVVEKRLPQDGRAIVRLQEAQIDLRISVMPSIYGESVVIRLLPVDFLFDLDELGFLPEDIRVLDGFMHRPHGIVFLTGPTGSGKTTTLYAFLNKLNKGKNKIITIEDPVEYELDGITQIQVRPDIGFSFAAALRSILRHDPDIMMVGEVRDFETAELAIRTALTGHLMFSTLHANDAASGPARLLDIGVEPYLAATSVNAFISQRLVRVICPFCKTLISDKALLPERLQKSVLYRGAGCRECNGMGFRGRTTLYEVLCVTPEIQALIMQKAPAQALAQAAAAQGFVSMRDIGVRKVEMGLTTYEEVLQSIGI